MDIITPSEMYWILMLDNISNMFCAFSVFLSVIAVIGLIFRTITTVSDTCSEYQLRRICRCHNVVVVAAMVCWFTFCFVPNTKQLAAIKVIPAIVNSGATKQIAEDAKDLYKLGIDGLKDALTRNRATEK